MRLGTFVASHPVFVVEVRVTHQTPRRATAFEKMVLRLVERAEHAESLGSAGLGDLFEGMLGVTEAHPLLEPTARELIELEVLRAPEGADLVDLPLREWTLTDAGRAFIQRGLLPGRPRYENLHYAYEPLADTLQLLRAPAVPSTPAPLHLDAVFPSVDLATRVQVGLQVEQHAWFEAATEVMAVDVLSDIESTRWKNVQFVLECGRDGRLDLQAPDDEAMARWLREARPEEVWRRLIWPVLGGPLPDAGDEHARQAPPEARHPLALASAAALVPWFAQHVAPIAWPAAADIRRGLVVTPASTLDAPDAAQALDRLELCGQRLERIQVAGPGIGWRVPPMAGEPSPHWASVRVMRPGAAPQVTVVGTATLLWAGQPRPTVLRMELDGAAVEVVRKTLLAPLDRAMCATRRLEDLPLAFWLEPADAVLARWLAGAATHTPQAWFDALRQCVQPPDHRSPEGPALDERLWIETILPRAAERLEQLRPSLGLSLTLDLIGAMAWMPHGRGALVAQVLAHAEPLDTLQCLAALRTAIGQLPGLLIPARLLGDGLRLQLLEVAMGDVPPGAYEHALGVPLREFGQAFQRSRSSITPVLLKAGAAFSADWTKAARARPRQLVAAVDTLDLAVEALVPVLGDEQGPAVSRLRDLQSRLRPIRSWVAEALCSPLEGGRRAVVFDTSSLMDRPDLLRRMPERDVPVIAKCVLSELDHLKTVRVADDPDDESRAQKARRAIRAIEEAIDRVRFEPSRREQCAQDWPDNADNEILSVGVFHALNDVVLVSGDRNLRNKAQAESLMTMDTDQYLTTTVPGRPANRSPKRPNPRQTTR